MNFFDRATPLWEKGWNVIPIPPEQKACTFKDWQLLSHQHRATKEQLREWNEREPRLNVGVLACPETICILDFDNLDALQKIQEETGVPAPQTFEVRSAGRGMPHLYFRQNYSTHWLRNCPGEGFDFQYDRKYVVGPGSEVRVNGQLKIYEIALDAPLANLPLAWAEWLKRHGAKRAVAIAGNDDWGAIGEGEGRQGRLVSFAARSWTEGTTEEELLEQTLEANQKFAVPKPEGKVRDIVNWVTERDQIKTGPRVELGKDGQVTELHGPDGINMTEMGNAERVLLAHKENILWVSGSNGNSAGMFFVWTGQRWEEDTAAKVPGMVKSVLRGLNTLVRAAVDQRYDSKNVEKVVAFWKQSEQEFMVRDVVKLIRPDVAIDRGKFDADPLLFNVQNGTLDLRTGEFRDAEREDYMTKVANVMFDKAAECPQWEKFLIETVKGDEEMLRYLRQCAGICLTGETRHHLFFIVLGPGGTGKTTFQETLKFVWGDYCCGVDPNSLAAGKAEMARARPDLAKLPGVRLAFANESRAGLRLDEGLLKSLVGGDTVTARQLYQAEFDFVPQYKLWLRTNERPVFDGADTGMQRRVRLILFDHIVEHKDSELPRRLRGEASGVLNWALTGLKDYQQNGLKEPESVLRASREYTDSLDIIKQFFMDCIETAPTYEEEAGLLYGRYEIWCEREHHRAYGNRRFAAELETRGFRKLHTRKGKVWVGLRVVQ
jgi:P4 family phage/plasmid primase-like protien